MFLSLSRDNPIVGHEVRVDRFIAGAHARGPHLPAVIRAMIHEVSHQVTDIGLIIVRPQVVDFNTRSNSSSPRQSLASSAQLPLKSFSVLGGYDPPKWKGVFRQVLESIIPDQLGTRQMAEDPKYFFIGNLLALEQSRTFRSAHALY